jgi:Small-conductance mechanosensitive channel
MGISGTLLDIGTFSSKIRKFDGTVIRIPNEKFFTSNIRSLTVSTVRRAEAMVGISYKDDIENAILMIKNEILVTMPFVLRVPEPEFRVDKLGDSSVNILVLVWHPRDDWSQVQPILLNYN